MTSPSRTPTPPSRRAVRPIARGHPRRLAGVLVVVGLVATAVGDAAPEGLHPDGPGPAIFAVLALLVATVPGRSMVALAVPVSVTFVVGALAVPRSRARWADPSAVLDVVSASVQLAGLLVAVVAGVVVLWPVRGRPRSGS
jgi:hypothetical protein